MKMDVLHVNNIIKNILFIGVIFTFTSLYATEELKVSISEVAPGVYRLRAGTPEKFTPSMFKQNAKLNSLKKMGEAAMPFKDIRVWQMHRGILIELPFKNNETIYGLGLQCKNLIQNGWRKTLISAPEDGMKGSGHAPVPFYVSTSGYGVLIDNARFLTFSMGEKRILSNRHEIKGDVKTKEYINSVEELYDIKLNKNTSIYVDIPAAKGIDIYLFAGPTMKDAVARYNLYSGGGFMPSLVNLGPECLVGTMLKEKEVLSTCQMFKKDNIAITAIGMEPGWQTHAYSSSYIWDNNKFSEDFVQKVKDQGYEMSLWCQLYLDPTCPIIPKLGNKFGNFEVWGGVVPDIFNPQVINEYSNFLTENFLKKGIFGFKLDEVDGSYGETRPYAEWMFPPFSSFPSGAEGDQTRNLFGRAGQKAIDQAFKNINHRSFGLVRASNAFSAPMPMAIYSDEYDFTDFVRYNLSAGVQGIIWSPEVRDAENFRDWSRRLAASAFSAKMVLNGWQFPNPAWQQPDLSKNERGDLLSEDNPYQKIAKRFTRLRMALIPYLYNAYYNYYDKGVSPVRPLILDYPNDVNAITIDDQWLLGDDILVAPLTDENTFSEYQQSKLTCEKFKGDKNVQFQMNGDEFKQTIPSSGVGLYGGEFFVDLKRGKARLKFLSKGEMSDISIRLRKVMNDKSMQDMSILYKDNVIIDDKEWSLYSFDFDVPQDGEYTIVLSKGYSLINTSSASILFKNLYVEQLLGEKKASMQRLVYLPKGNWRDFWTNKSYEGDKDYVLTATNEQPLVFVKENTIIPMAEPLLIADRNALFNIKLVAYGDHPSSFVLYEDDGDSYNFEKGDFSKIEISSNGRIKREKGAKQYRYKIEKGIDKPEKIFSEFEIN